MKKLFYLSIFFLVANGIDARDVDTVCATDGNRGASLSVKTECLLDGGKQSFTKAEMLPQFPGGGTALKEYLKKAINYPEKCIKTNVEGRTIVNFVVDKKGKIKNVEIFKSSGNKLLDNEAIRIIKKMPRWEVKAGEYVGGSQFSLPVDFKLCDVNPILGTWQLCSVIESAEGKRKISVYPAIKIINGDNTYSSMFTHSNNSTGRIIQRGEYKIISDSVYNEKILVHMNSKLEGSTTFLKYSFIDEKKEIMKIEYVNAVQNLASVEYWVRILPLY